MMNPLVGYSLTLQFSVAICVITMCQDGKNWSPGYTAITAAWQAQTVPESHSCKQKHDSPEPVSEPVYFSCYY